MVCEGTRTLAATSRSSGPPFQSRVVGVARRRDDDALGVHIDRVRRHARIAAAEIEMVRRRAGERDQFALDEDRREDEHVLQVLAAAVGIVVDVEVAGLAACASVHCCGAGAEDLRHRAQVHRDQLGLRDDVASRVEQCGGRVLGLAHDVGVGRADELGAHLAGDRDQRLADDGVVDGIELAGLSRRSAARPILAVDCVSCMVTRRSRMVLSLASRRAVQPDGTRGSRSGPRSAPGPQICLPASSAPRRSSWPSRQALPSKISDRARRRFGRPSSPPAAAALRAAPRRPAGTTRTRSACRPPRRRNRRAGAPRRTCGARLLRRESCQLLLRERDRHLEGLTDEAHIGRQRRRRAALEAARRARSSARPRMHLGKDLAQRIGRGIVIDRPAARHALELHEIRGDEPIGRDDAGGGRHHDRRDAELLGDCARHAAARRRR